MVESLDSWTFWSVLFEWYKDDKLDSQIYDKWQEYRVIAFPFCLLGELHSLLQVETCPVGVVWISYLIYIHERGSIVPNFL